MEATYLLILVMLTIFAVYVYVVSLFLRDATGTSEESLHKPTRVYNVQEFRETLLRQLNVEIKGSDEKHYEVGFQGGYFIFAFSENNRYLKILYPHFAELKYEKLDKALETINSINLRHSWTSILSYSSDTEKPITASCKCLCTLHSAPEDCAIALKNILVGPFYIAREFHEELSEREKAGN